MFVCLLIQFCDWLTPLKDERDHRNWPVLFFFFHLWFTRVLVLMMSLKPGQKSSGWVGRAREYLVLVFKSLTLEILWSFHAAVIQFLLLIPWIMMMWRYYLKISLKQIPICPFSIILRQEKDRESRTEKHNTLFSKEEGLYFPNKLMWGYSFILIQSGKRTKQKNSSTIKFSSAAHFGSVCVRDALDRGSALSLPKDQEDKTASLKNAGVQEKPDSEQKNKVLLRWEDSILLHIYIFFNIYLYIFNVAFYEQIFAKMNLFIVQEQTGLTIDAHWPRTLYHSSKKAIAKLNIV